MEKHKDDWFEIEPDAPAAWFAITLGILLVAGIFSLIWVIVTW